MLIIAEAGVNHNGSPHLAHALVDVAADAGADAVKFQTFVPELVVGPAAPTAAYQRRPTREVSQLEMVRRLSLPESAWPELASHARDRGLLFLSTAFDLRSVELLERLDIQAFKVPSGEVTNLPFIRELARRDKPLILSTGMAEMEEVRAAVAAAAAAPSVTLLHCVSAYPTPVENANLRAITTMRKEFTLAVGWSDHTIGELTAILAIGLGASVLEKHVTLDRKLPGPDHIASADPAEFAFYVTTARLAERALGDGVKAAAAVEDNVRAVARRSWHATRRLSIGHRIHVSDVIALRPGTGISPATSIEGRIVARPLEPDSMIVESDLEGPGAGG